MSAITTEGQALLADILADPADDGLRLIYADWLEDTGQPDRAELIRRKLCGPTFRRPLGQDDPRSLSAWTRVREPQWIFRGHYRAAFDAMAVYDWPDGTEVYFEAGFIHTVHCPLQAWRGHGPAVVRAHPVVRVEVTDRSPYQVSLLPSAHGWFRPSDSLPSLSGPCCLPQPIWKLLTNHSWLNSHFAGYPSPEAAVDALSDALLAYARSA